MLGQKLEDQGSETWPPGPVDSVIRGLAGSHSHCCGWEGLRLAKRWGNPSHSDMAVGYNRGQRVDDW